MNDVDSQQDQLEIVADRCARLVQSHVDEVIAQQLLAVYDEYGIDGLLWSLRTMADRSQRAS